MPCSRRFAACTAVFVALMALGPLHAQSEKAGPPASHDLMHVIPIWEGTPLKRQVASFGCEASSWSSLCRQTTTIKTEDKLQICSFSVQNVNKNNKAHFTVTEATPSRISIEFYAEGSGNILDRWGSHIKIDLHYTLVPFSLDTKALEQLGCSIKTPQTNACHCYKPTGELIASPNWVCYQNQCEAECKRLGGYAQYGGKEGCN